jgi:NADPH-dependent 2,4-dienoyl-CoA reductase/sulfur reductase-like enzyme
MMRLLIIGGSDAGISAALRAREIDPTLEVTVLVADRFPNFSICGLPFYLSGEVQDWRSLAHRTTEDIEKEGIRLLINHRAKSIDADLKTVRIKAEDGKEFDQSFDRLLIGTGAVSAAPPIAGLDLPGVFFLRWMEDSFAVHRYLTQNKPRSAAIIGGGYIGMEMADALTYRGMAVTVIETAETVLTTVDADLGHKVRSELEKNGVRVETGRAVNAIVSENEGLKIIGASGLKVTADMVLVAVGAAPDAKLAQTAGIKTGIGGAIKVDRCMRTNVPDVFAAGDCVETWHRLLETYTYLPLGSTAHKQGRVAGENMVGGQAEFQGTLGTQVIKIFDLVVARTGLRGSGAKAASYDALTVEFDTWDHKVYYPGAEKMCIRITGDRQSSLLLGAQIVGHRKSEISKRIDIFATALYHNMMVADLNHIDLSYTPPLSSPWDPVQMSAQAWSRAVREFQNIS